MLYQLKTMKVSAIQWTGQNTNEVIEFLENRGFLTTQLERKPNNQEFKIKVGAGWLDIPKGNYIVIDANDAIEAMEAEKFEDAFKPVE